MTEKQRKTPIAHRAFSSYEKYVEEQGGKAVRLRKELLAGLPKSIKSFEGMLLQAKPYMRKGAVLCLGARTGAEATAARNLGFKGSVGIDLHPVGADVIQADWHRMPFEASSFANAYSNSLDHCLSLDELAAEVRRVLQPEGVFVVMASDRWPGKNLKEWLAKGGNEALFWQCADDLRDAIVERGFRQLAAWKHGQKWGCFALTPSAL